MTMESEGANKLRNFYKALDMRGGVIMVLREGRKQFGNDGSGLM